MQSNLTKKRHLERYLRFFEIGAAFLIIIYAVSLFRSDIEFKDITLKWGFILLALISYLIAICFNFGAWHFARSLMSNSKIDLSDTLQSLSYGIAGKYVPGKFLGLAARYIFDQKNSLTPKNSARILAIEQLSFLQAVSILASFAAAGMIEALHLGSEQSNLLYLVSIVNDNLYLILFLLIAPSLVIATTNVNLVKINLTILLTTIFSGGLAASAFYFCLVGLSATSISFWPIISAALLANALAYLVFIVPAGMGVREAGLVLILSSTSLPAELTAIAAILFRLITVSGDVAVITLTALIKRRHSSF